MPAIRGMFIPEREKSRIAKRSLDVLLWIELLDRHDVSYLQMLEQLRVYLQRCHRETCQIRLLVPDIFDGTQRALQMNRIPFEVVTSPEVTEGFLAKHPKLSHDLISRPALCALVLGADCIVFSKASPALSFLEDVSESLRCLLTDASFLHVIAEVYVRGFDIAWTFKNPIWNGTWQPLYLYADSDITGPLRNLAGAALGVGLDRDTVEAIWSIAVNRMPQVCYTRDKLLWLSLQREAARRDGFTNQTYIFEISYHLNFYYLLLSGTLDHLALVVNGVYGLGLPETAVGATYRRFLAALQGKSTNQYALFTSDKITEFIARLGALRNLAAHRGSITPRKIVENPKVPPTPDEIDEHLRATGRDWVREEPFCSMMPQVVTMARSIAVAELLEKNTIAEDVEIIEYQGRSWYLSPVLDISWNFAIVRQFALAVTRECSSHIATLRSQQAP